jgi:microcompartment protein CcmK/EutM
MRLGRVVGTVVSTVKARGLTTQKLLVVSDVNAVEPRRSDEAGAPYVAVDLVGAGDGEIVLVTHGSAARTHTGSQEIPTDAAIIGIVDSVQLGSRRTFVKS